MWTPPVRVLEFAAGGGDGFVRTELIVSETLPRLELASLFDAILFMPKMAANKTTATRKIFIRIYTSFKI
jgi:hypothetical protein